MDILDQRPWPARALDHLEARGEVLAPLGYLYAIGARLRRRVRKSTPLVSPPLSVTVGNLRVGGTGKTPVVADLAVRWQKEGRKVAVASRGYRAASGGDEPGWLRDQLGIPVYLGADRAASFAQACSDGVEVLLLDDAFQSSVRAAVQLVIVLDRDIDRPPRVLPAGPAREGAETLQRAHAVLVRSEDGTWPPTPADRWRYQRFAEKVCGGRAFAFRLRPDALVDTDDNEVATSRLRRPVVLASGLARPESFERSAQRMGLRPVASVRLADHAAFDAREMKRIANAMREYEARTLVCPEKNFRRLTSMPTGWTTLGLRAKLEWDRDPLELLAALIGD